MCRKVGGVWFKVTSQLPSRELGSHDILFAFHCPTGEVAASRCAHLVLVFQHRLELFI